MGYRIGVDIGGTFTDFCVFDDETRALHSLKVLSTPATPGAEVLEGMRQLRERFGIDPGDVVSFIHGQTVGVNTVIQRKGARLCLMLTENFSDVLEMERLRMRETFNLNALRPEPLVPKDRVMPVRERMLADGTIDTPLDPDGVRAGIEMARRCDAEGVLVSFLHAYRNPEHELAAKAIIEAEAPHLFVFCSHEVWPLIREYERTITAVINGYVHPRVAAYLTSLQKALADEGVAVQPMVAKSNGGVMNVERGKRDCVQILLSGTASGVMAASHVAGLGGFDNVISLDIGGTSADVALVIDGKPQYGVGERVGEFQLHIPSVAVSSIGDGGGSIAWVDDHGVLKVGPESAGAEPGPACYGRGGERPTLTDAYVVCGYLGDGALAYNSVTLNVERADAAIRTLGGRIGLEPRQTAEAVIRVAVSGMYLELSKLIARHGIDPRQFSLMAFGGAGPMAACFIARELEIGTIVVPKSPGVLSALGGLVSDVKNDFIRSAIADVTVAATASIRDGFAQLRTEAEAWIRQEQQFGGPPEFSYSADMRYKGQSFEIEVPLEIEWIDAGRIEETARAFHDAHERVYDYCDRAAPAQFINLRIVACAPVQKPDFAPAPSRAGAPEPYAHKPIFEEGILRTAPFYERRNLTSGHRFDGPAVVTQDDATTLVLSDYGAEVDTYGNLLLKLKNMEN